MGVSPAGLVPEPLQRKGLKLHNVIGVAPALVPPKTTAGLGFGFFFLRQLLFYYEVFMDVAPEFACFGEKEGKNLLQPKAS